MGPRPDGRGKRADVKADSRSGGQRQWGRGQTAAESWRRRRRRRRANLRQWGRGQTAAERAAAHVGRGHAAGVNGAAARRPRKGGRRRKRAAHRAASMGPRPDGRGKSSSAGVPDCGIRRQWGRGQTAAERHCPGRPRSSLPRVNGAAARRPRKGGAWSLAITVTWRQWGRGQTAAERRRRRSLSGSTQRRQWGRGQTAAESRARRSALSSPYCVNGAAARRPRKEERPPGTPITTLKRQWGRGQTAAERGAVGAVHGAVRQASMGPRPDGRGKLSAW